MTEAGDRESLLPYELRGELANGPVLMLARGSLAPRLANAALSDELEAHIQVVGFDPRGTGRSPRGGPYTIEQDASDMGAILDAVGRPAALFANGNSARSALVLGARGHPLLRGLVLWNDHPGGWAAASGLGQSEDVRALMLQALETSYRSAITQAADLFWPGSSPELRAQLVDAILEEIPPEACIGRSRAWIEHDGSALPAQVRVPVRYLTHEDDSWWPPAAMRAVAALFPDGGAVTIDALPSSGVDRFAPELLEVVADLAPAEQAR